jgi:acyl carrier protein
MDPLDSALKLHIKQLVLRVCDVQGVDPASLGDDATVFGVPPANLNSLDAVEIAVALEHEFGFRIENASSVRAHFHSISAMADLVRQHSPPETLQRALGKSPAQPS